MRRVSLPIETADEAEIIKDRLYFATVSARPTHQYPGYHLFSTDDEFVYANYNSDFGPLNIAMLYRFCNLLNHKLKTPPISGKRVVYYTGVDPCKRTNAAFLVGSYSILYLGRSADEAYVTIAVGSRTVFKPFRDASAGPSTFNLTLLDTLHAVAKASLHRILNFVTFNVDDYEHYEKVENGDMNWIVPKKLLAFSTPHVNSRVVNGYQLHSPEAYLPYFRRNNVTAVVRLNNKLYNSAVFVGAGIAHFDLFFADGGTPNDDIVEKFLTVCEKTEGAVAVHCKAGLGRTGTLVGCFLMKHFKFTAAEAIAWTRITRPGSVLGPQQLYMLDKQQDMWTAGEAYRRKLAEASAERPTETAGLRTTSLVAVCSNQVPVTAPILNSSSQGDQLNRLKLQRFSQGQSQGQGQKVAPPGVKRQRVEQDVNQSNRVHRYQRRMRS